MSKVTGPFFSLAAAGTFGKTLTYQGRKGTTAVFLPVTPYDPKSIGQLAIREYITRGVFYWRTMGAPYQELWRKFVK